MSVQAERAQSQHSPTCLAWTCGHCQTTCYVWYRTAESLFRQNIGYAHLFRESGHCHGTVQLVQCGHVLFAGGLATHKFFELSIVAHCCGWAHYHSHGLVLVRFQNLTFDPLNLVSSSPSAWTRSSHSMSSLANCVNDEVPQILLVWSFWINSTHICLVGVDKSELLESNMNAISNLHSRCPSHLHTRCEENGGWLINCNEHTMHYAPLVVRFHWRSNAPVTWLRFG